MDLSEKDRKYFYNKVAKLYRAIGELKEELKEPAKLKEKEPTDADLLLERLKKLDKKRMERKIKEYNEKIKRKLP